MPNLAQDLLYHVYNLSHCPTCRPHLQETQALPPEEKDKGGPELSKVKVNLEAKQSVPELPPCTMVCPLQVWYQPTYEQVRIKCQPATKCLVSDEQQAPAVIISEEPVADLGLQPLAQAPPIGSRHQCH